MTQLRILGKLRYTWGPNFKVVLLMILVCQVHYYNIGSTLNKYECRELDICLDICDIWFYKKGPLKSSKILQLVWNFLWLDKIKIYCHLSFSNFSVRQVSSQSQGSVITMRTRRGGLWSADLLCLTTSYFDKCNFVLELLYLI